MSTESILLVVASAVSSVSALYLILHPHYPDGVFGRMSLMAIATAGIVVMVNTGVGWKYSVHNSTLTMYLGIALLLVRRAILLLRHKDEPVRDGS